MKIKYFVIAAVAALSSSPVFADRPLSSQEILQIFERLTSQPRKTWIGTGTIEATHEEYRAPKITDVNEINRIIQEQIQQYQNNPAKRELTEEMQKMKFDSIPFNVRYKLSNEYTMRSNVVIKVDGGRFYWEINVEARTDSVKPGTDLTGNFMTGHFDLNINKKRIFAWDGQNFTNYSMPANRAVVNSTGSTPHAVNGPLTAGIIPWGYGYYTYQNLSAIESSAEEKIIDGQNRIYLTLNHSDGSIQSFVMDTAKDYAVISSVTTTPDNPTVSQHYSGYSIVSSRWVPDTVLIEQHDKVTNKLLGSDLWHITKISDSPPAADSFNVQYETDAFIEYFSPLSDEPLIYQYSNILDTDSLLAERLQFIANEGIQPQNCATASMKHAVKKLNKDVPEQQFAQLINEANGTSSLYSMKEFALDLGLYCRAVKTDIETLKKIENCQVILHIPSKNHFVVLAGIDSDYVWTADTANKKFLNHTDISFFNMDWTSGVALLLSNQPINGEFAEIGNDELQDITGSGYFYKCTRLLQEYNVVFCDNPFPGVCGGLYQVYFTRYGCEPAETGYCNTSVLVRYSETPCIVDPYNPSSCTVTGDWTSYYMKACM